MLLARGGFDLQRETTHQPAEQMGGTAGIHTAQTLVADHGVQPMSQVESHILSEGELVNA